MRAVRDGLERLLDHVLQIERHRIEIEFAGFDLGKIENVVDDREQAFARHAHGVDVLALLGIEVRIEQQFGHADHAVHRGANLVAHRREEIALRAARLFGGVLRLFARGDVGHHADQLFGAGAGAFHDAHRGAEPELGAVRRAHPMFEALRVVGFLRRGERFECDRTIVGHEVIEPEAVFVQPLLDRKSEHFLGFAINEVAARSVDVGAEQHDLRGFDELPQALFAAIESERLRGEAAVDERGHDRNDERDRGNAHDADDAERRHGDRVVVVGGVGHRHEVHGRHAGIMHDRNRRTHDDGAREFAPAARRRGVAESERHAQRDDRDDDRDDHRRDDDDRIVDAHRGKPHRFHADVMHRRDAGAHQDAAENRGAPVHAPPADQEQRDGRCSNGRKQRDHHERPVVTHVDRQPVGQHADVVHRPDAQAHRDRPAGEPDVARQSAGRGDAAGEVERRI